jgi:hypothetical protein
MDLRLFLLLLLVPTVDCFGKVTRLDPGERKNIEHPATVTMRRSLRDLPRPVISACALISADRHFRLAEPGRPFQVTDALGPGDEDLPRRRLIWAAEVPGYYVVHYESGGIAHSYHLLLVAIDESRKKARVTWAAAAVWLSDYADFVRALKNGKLDDTLDYFH